MVLIGGERAGQQRAIERLCLAHPRLGFLACRAGVCQRGLGWPRLTEVEAAWRINIESAQERVEAAVRAEAEGWAEQIEERRRKADGAFSRALAKLREAEGERAELAAAARWLQALAEGRPLHPARRSDGRLDARHPHHADAKLPLSLALDLIEQYAETSSVEGERRQTELDAAREAQAEERRERLGAARAGGAMAP
jgi:hypothetical protein